MKWSEVTRSCPTLCDPMDCSLPGSSLHGILQARVLEWVAISFSRGYSRPRDRTGVYHIPGRRFDLWATRKPQNSQHNAQVKNTTESTFFTLLVLGTTQTLASYRISRILLAWLSHLIQQSCKERLSPFYEWETEVQKVYVLRLAWSPKTHKSCRNLDPGLPGTNTKHSWNFL